VVRFSWLVVAGSLLAAAGCQTPKAIPLASPPPARWPTTTWATATPESQGMQSQPLVDMLDHIEDVRQAALDDGQRIAVDSITVVRHGVVVADLYPNRMFAPGQPHIIHSCTKSVMAALVGIAIDQGHIADVDTPLLDFFPDVEVAHVDDRKRALTLRHVLQMQTGLDSRDSYLFKWEGLFAMQATDDWVQHALSLPMDAEPGTRFDYSNIASFLLSAVVARATGQDTFTFAQQHLFAPLGITDVRWEASPKGVYMGWARMWLQPRDMAKFGLLMLQQGQWEGQQVVSASWVRDTLTSQGDPSAYRAFVDDEGNVNHQLSTGYWLYANLARPFSDGYGYQWWLDDDGLATALGHQGQYITLVPEHDLVVVVTGKLIGDGALLPPRLVNDFIVPAVVADGPIDDDKAAQSRLLASHVPPSATTKATPPSTSPTAAAVSGVRFALRTNPWRREALQLTFVDDADTATLVLTERDGPVAMHVGLDGRHRRSRVGDDVIAARGRWTSDNVFVVEHETIGYSILARYTLTFTKVDGALAVDVEEFGVTGLHTYRGDACPSGER